MEPELNADYERDVRALLARIDAQQGLLACYRIGSRPSEALMKRLDKSKVEEQRIRAQIDGLDAAGKLGS